MIKQRVAILITALIGMLAIFLPWVQAPNIGTINGTKAGGWIISLLYLVSFVVCFTGNRQNGLVAPKLYAAVIPAIAAAVLGAWKIINSTATYGVKQDNALATLVNAHISVKIGLYLVVAAGIALTAFAFGMEQKNQSRQSMFS